MRKSLGARQRVPPVYEHRTNVQRSKAEWHLRATLLRETPIATLTATTSQNMVLKRPANPWEGNVLQKLAFSNWVQPLCLDEIVPSSSKFTLPPITTTLLKQPNGFVLSERSPEIPVVPLPQSALPETDFGGLLVLPDAKTLLPYLWRLPQFRKFLFDGGSIWCITFAEFVLRNCQTNPSAPSFETAMNQRGGIDGVCDPDQVERIAVAMHRVFVDQITAAATKLMLMSLLQRMQMILTTTDMESNGIFIDPEVLSSQIQAVEQREEQAKVKLDRRLPSFVNDHPNCKEFEWGNPAHLRYALFGNPSPWQASTKQKNLRLPFPSREVAVPKLALFLAAETQLVDAESELAKRLFDLAETGHSDAASYLTNLFRSGDVAGALPVCLYVSAEVVAQDESSWSLASLHLFSPTLGEGVEVDGELEADGISRIARLIRAAFDLKPQHERHLLFIGSAPSFPLERLLRSELFASDDFIDAIGGDTTVCVSDISGFFSLFQEAEDLERLTTETQDAEYDDAGLMTMRRNPVQLDANRGKTLGEDIRAAVSTNKFMEASRLSKAKLLDAVASIVPQSADCDDASQGQLSTVEILAVLGLTSLLVLPDAFVQMKMSSMSDLEREDAALLAGLRMTDKTSHGILAGLAAKAGPTGQDHFITELSRHEPQLSNELRALFEAQEAKQSFSTTLFSSIHPDNVVRAKFNHNAVATARLSAMSPNVMSIPTTQHVRQVFLSRFGRDHGVMIEMDYSQLELVVMAWLAGDEALTADFQKGIDFHSRRVTFLRSSLSYDDVIKGKEERDPVILRLRKQAKIYSFQSIYGASVSAIADATGLTVEEVKQIRKEEAAAYPGLELLYNHINLLAGSGASGTRVIPLPTGTRIEFQVDKNRSHITGIDPKIKNYPVQATAAELVQAALGVFWREVLNRPSWQGNVLLVNTVHDSVWIDCRKEFSEDVIDLGVKVLEAIPQHIEAMFPGLKCDLSFPVDVSIGPSLAEMQHVSRKQ